MNIMISGLCINFGAAFLSLLLIVWTSLPCCVRTSAGKTPSRWFLHMSRMTHGLVGVGFLGVGAAAALLLPTRYALDGYCGDVSSHNHSQHTAHVNEFTTDAKYWGLFAWLLVIVVFKATHFAICYAP